MNTRMRRDEPLLTGSLFPVNDPLTKIGIAVWCPSCKVDHHHGWDGKIRDKEHRWAHCVDGSPYREKGYWVAIHPSHYPEAKKLLAKNNIQG